MRDGFYSLFQAGGDQNPADEDAYGLVALAHFRDGRFVGADRGGCRISGDYRVDGDGRLAVHLIYDFKAGTAFPSGTLKAETRREFDFLFALGALEGEPQPIDIGLGPMFMRLQWLAEPA